MATKKKVKKAVRRPAARKVKKVVRKTVKKAASKKTVAKKTTTPKAVGRVTHFYREIKVAVVKFSKPIKQGTEVSFRGATTDFKQKLDSMQYDHKALATAPKGKQVGVKVKSRVREGDQVYL